MEPVTTQETLFYTGTYASADEPGIFLCALNADTGEMRIVNHMDGVNNPSYLALSPDGNCLYVASETDEGEVLVYRRDAATSEPAPDGSKTDQRGFSMLCVCLHGWSVGVLIQL